MEEDGSDEGDLSDEDDSVDVEMSDDDGLDDDMTLNQYQDEVRREALIRKNSNSAEVSPKKGRINAGSSLS